MITFCIPTKNNLRYLKHAVQSIRENQHYDNDIVLYIDESNDGTLTWAEKDGINFIYNTLGTPNGIAYGYNRCITMASHDIVCMFHADMYMGKGFDVNIVKHLKEKCVVAGTRIEPPLHPEGREKIVHDFGMYPEDFKKDDFNWFVSQACLEYGNQTTRGIFAPWACWKDDIIEMGMHDENFHSYHEDTDIFNRFVLKGMNIIQSWDALVYHFTCRGGQFQDGIESVTKDEAFHKMKKRAAMEFIRKWGTFIHNDPFCYPIVYPVYDVGLAISNVPDDAQAFGIISQMEPWFSNVYIDSEVVSNMLIQETNTKTDMVEKIREYDSDFINDIVLIADYYELTTSQESFQMASQVVQNLPLILKDTEEIGDYEYGPFHISISNLTTYEKDLITL